MARAPADLRRRLNTTYPAWRKCAADPWGRLRAWAIADLHHQGYVADLK